MGSVVVLELKHAFNQCRYIPRMLKLVWNVAKKWTCAWCVLLVVRAFLPVAVICITRLFINRLVLHLRVKGGGEDFRAILFFAFLLGGLLLVIELCRIAIHWIQTAQSELVKDHITNLIHHQSMTLDLAFYDSPDYYDHLHRAREEARYRPVALLESLGIFFQNTITLMAMAALLLSFSPWLTGALLVSTIPAFCAVIYSSLREHHWIKRTTSDERRSWYYDWLLTSVETAAELRLFGLGEYFGKTYQAIRQQLREGRLRVFRIHGITELAAGIVALGVMGFVMILMIRRVFLGLMSFGDFVLFYQAFSQGQGLMRLLLQNIGKIYANSFFLGNLFEFLDLKPSIVNPEFPTSPSVGVKEGILFRNVTFSYPRNTKPVLQDFNLEVPAGQVVAIVGPNGAGKSTLIKLLSRLYDPQAGAIEFDGIDVREISIEDLRRQITVLFQQPVHYSATAEENIALGDIKQIQNVGEIESAAQAAGADEMISSLPYGYSTMLGNWFSGGTELSVGQWQRIALARAFLRKAPIILLDEPTSAMDPWAEANWFKRFHSLAQGRTVVIITHRFTTAMQADRIHVMVNGQIVESGSHEELLAYEGLYAQSWATQMQMNRERQFVYRM